MLSCSFGFNFISAWHYVFLAISRSKGSDSNALSVRVKLVFGAFVNKFLLGIDVLGKEDTGILPSKSVVAFLKPSFIICGTPKKPISFFIGFPSVSNKILPFLSNSYSNFFGSYFSS